MTAGEFNDLGDFCFGDLVRKDPTNPHTVPMDMQHNQHCFVPGFVKKTFEDEYDKLHGGKVVVQQ